MSDWKKQYTFLDDGLKKNDDSSVSQSLLEYYESQRRLRAVAGSAFLFSRGRKTTRFFTEDSRRYSTPRESYARQKGFFSERRLLFDAAQRRFIEPKRTVGMSLRMNWWYVCRKTSHFGSVVTSIPDNISFRVPTLKMWNFSLVGALLFGMISMTMIYRSLGQSASAEEKSLADMPQRQELATTMPIVDEAMEWSWGSEGLNINADADEGKTSTEAPALPVESFEEQKSPVSFSGKYTIKPDDVFGVAAKDMVEGYPIEQMLPYILEQDKKVAAYLIAIAKKESNWGKRVPVYNGRDCYNYWGYRGIRKTMGTGGHTCFETRKDAVETVAKRLDALVNQKKLDTPAKLIVWKCGFSCAGHSDYSVKKWISDVDLYWDKLNKKKKG